MRLLFLTPLYIPWVGGLEIFVRALTAELRARGHEIFLITSHGPETTAGLADVDGVPVLRVSAHGAIARRDPAGLFQVQRAINGAAREFRPDVVHSHDAGPVLWMYLRASRHRSMPLAVTLHNVMTHHFEGALDLLGSLLDQADVVTGVSQDVVDDVLVYAPSVADRIAVIRNGVPPTVANPTPVPVDRPRFLCLGRLVRQKGFDRAIDAVALLVARGREVRLTIAGDGPDRAALEALAATRGVADRVEFVGMLDRDAVVRAFEDATAVLMPSHFEGLPLVAIEAAWSGRPVVATRAPGLDQAVVDGQTAIVTDPDAAALAAGVERLVDDPALARRLGAGARAHAEREYSLTACADAYERVYEGLRRDRVGTGR